MYKKRSAGEEGKPLQERKNVRCKYEKLYLWIFLDVSSVGYSLRTRALCVCIHHYKLSIFLKILTINMLHAEFLKKEKEKLYLVTGNPQTANGAPSGQLAPPSDDGAITSAGTGGCVDLITQREGTQETKGRREVPFVRFAFPLRDSEEGLRDGGFKGRRSFLTVCYFQDQDQEKQRLTRDWVLPWG